MDETSLPDDLPNLIHPSFKTKQRSLPVVRTIAGANGPTAGDVEDNPLALGQLPNCRVMKAGLTRVNAFPSRVITSRAGAQGRDWAGFRRHGNIHAAMGKHSTRRTRTTMRNMLRAPRGRFPRECSGYRPMDPPGKADYRRPEHQKDEPPP